MVEEQSKISEHSEDKDKFDWTNYNKSQTQEKLIFMRLLDELCQISDTDADLRNGRMHGNYSHKIFCICLKTYLGTSSRRMNSDLEIARNMKYLAHRPHFNTVLNYFNDKSIKKVLKYLIELSALPLAQLERSFSVDSSGISLRQYQERWSSAKNNYSLVRNYKKMHLIYGNLTNIVVTCAVTRGNDNDSPYFKKLLSDAAKNFTMEDICADKAYSSRDNIELANQLNINPFIPFKSHTTDKARGFMSWKKAYSYFHNHREEFLKRYHLRSNAEAGMHMIKSRFGDFVRSRNEISQENEILCKILCHNICVLIQEIFLHNIQFDFLGLSKKFAQEKD